MEHNTPEMHELIFKITNAQKNDDLFYQNWKSMVGDKNIQPPVRSETRVLRKQVRYRLFRIRDAILKKEISEEFDCGLSKWMELQFAQGMNWANFTFEWDVSAVDPLMVIEPIQWDGGVVLDKNTGRRYYDPPAFTHQE
jgi:hypothetical protein